MVLHHALQRLLAFQEGQRSKIPAIVHQAVEGVEHWLTTAAQQFVELWPAGSIEHDDFAVEDFRSSALKGTPRAPESSCTRFHAGRSGGTRWA